MFLDNKKNREIIDFLRAAGILLVICFHVIVGIASLLDRAEFERYVAAMPSLFNIAWQALGSELVFLFSGFLLAALLLRELDSTGRIDFRDFYVRRAARILPLYVVGLVLYAFVMDFTALEFLLNLLFVSKLFDAGTIIPVGWSLEVLVQFYVLCPLLVLILVRSGHAVALTLVAIVASLGARFAALLGDPPSYLTSVPEILLGGGTTATQESLYYHLGFRATPFLLGFLLAYLVMTRHDELQQRFKHYAVIVPAMAAATALIAVGGFLPIHDPGSFLYTRLGTEFWLLFWTLQRFLFALGVCLLALCLWYGDGRLLRPLQWLARRRIWQTVSANIYAIYLFHPVFLIPAAMIGFRAVSIQGAVPIHVAEVSAVIALVIVASVSFGRLVSRHFEWPAAARLKNLLARRTPGRHLGTTAPMK